MTTSKSPGLPHHVIQRGIDGQQLFFTDEDYRSFIGILAEACAEYDVMVWCYCLMPDHIHLIAIPISETAIDDALGTAIRRYTESLKKKGAPVVPLFRGKAARHLLDDTYLIRCARYVEINAVKRDYVTTAQEWPWSSTKAHIKGEDDILVSVAPLLDRIRQNWSDFLATPIPSQEADLFYAHELSGEPMGEGRKSMPPAAR